MSAIPCTSTSLAGTVDALEGLGGCPQGYHFVGDGGIFRVFLFSITMHSIDRKRLFLVIVGCARESHVSNAPCSQIDGGHGGHS